MYAVKEIYYTLQGEGANTGRPAVLLRFAGCNLWSGREEDRLTATCQFCDTDFFGTDGINGGKYESEEVLAAAVLDQWPANGPTARFVVCTGGEPLLQLDRLLIDRLHDRGFEIAVETNGTLEAPAELDWVCVSPKAGTLIRQTAASPAQGRIHNGGWALQVRPSHAARKASKSQASGPMNFQSHRYLKPLARRHSNP